MQKTYFSCFCLQGYKNNRGDFGEPFGLVRPVDPLRFLVLPKFPNVFLLNVFLWTCFYERVSINVFLWTPNENNGGKMFSISLNEHLLNMSFTFQSKKVEKVGKKTKKRKKVQL